MSTNVHELRVHRPGAATVPHVRSEPRHGTTLLSLLGQLRERFALARKRRAAIDELAGLNDHQLHDIGVRRDQIPELVDRMLRQASGSGR